MTDSFQYTADSLMAPATNCFAIATSDSADLPRITKGIYVGEGGSVRLLSVIGDTEVTFVNVPSGAVLDVRARAVRATGTTAGSLVGMA